MQHLLRVLCALLVISVIAPRTWAEEIIDTVTDAAQRSTLAQAAQTLLSGITPQQGKGTTEGTSQIKDGHFLIWGELFEKGRTVAVVELGDRIALADWDAQKASWTVTQVIKVPVYWLHPGTTEGERDTVPDDLPAKPFWVKQLAPSVPRLLVVSTDHSRYHAGRFVFAYDAKVHALDVDGALFSVAEPVLREGYVVLTNDSGRKAWWGMEYYYQVERSTLKYRGSLREGSYNGDDLHLHVGFTKPGSSEETTWRFNATPDDQSSFKIQAGDEGPDEEKDPVIGHIRFRKGSTGDQAAFLLHKLTGLPATLVNPNLFSGGDAPQVQMPNLTDRDVEVTGNAEVLRLLGPAKAAENRPSK